MLGGEYSTNGADSTYRLFWFTIRTKEKGNIEINHWWRTNPCSCSYLLVFIYLALCVLTSIKLSKVFVWVFTVFTGEFLRQIFFHHRHHQSFCARNNFTSHHKLWVLRHNLSKGQLSNETLVQWDFCPRKLYPIGRPAPTPPTQERLFLSCSLLSKHGGALWAI